MHSYPRYEIQASGEFVVPAASSPWTDPCFPLFSRLNGPQRQSGRFGEEKKPLPRRK